MKTVLSQGEVRPGVVQAQCWREIGYRTWTLGPDGEHVPLYVLGERRGETKPTPRSYADPRLSNRVER